jgi:hypothetical protein
MNTAYRNLTLVRIQGAIAAAEAARHITHQGLKGQLREIFMRELLRPLLPVYIGLGTGQIITADNLYSPQQDVIVYDTRLLPPFLAEPSVGLFPIESVLYAIEVKSELNAGELRTAHGNAKIVRSFALQPGHYDKTDSPQAADTLSVVTCVFAFSSDLTESSEIDRYKHLHGAEEPALLQLCVVGKGHWWWYRQKWNEALPTNPFREVLGWLAGVVTNAPRIAQTRGAPRVSRYWLWDPGSGEILA